jgi:uncharacterized protein (DUF2062 family)
MQHSSSVKQRQMKLLFAKNELMDCYSAIFIKEEMHKARRWPTTRTSNCAPGDTPSHRERTKKNRRHQGETILQIAGKSRDHRHGPPRTVCGSCRRGKEHAVLSKSACRASGRPALIPISCVSVFSFRSTLAPSRKNSTVAISPSMHKRFRNHWFLKHMPTQESIRQYRLLRPLSRFLDHHALWQFNRRSVAGGVAVGLFFSIATPFIQIPLAAMFAILFRVNIPIAAFSTLLSNPFTTPAILYCAYKIGAILTGQPASAQAAVVDNAATSEISGLLEQLAYWTEWLMSAGMPLVVGLAVISVLLTVFGYLGVKLLWQLQIRLRWRARDIRRRQVQGGTVV